MDVGPWIPALTAALTLGNSVFLWYVNRRTRKIAKETNGMKMQLLADAEARGRRQERAGLSAAGFVEGILSSEEVDDSQPPPPTISSSRL